MTLLELLLAVAVTAMVALAMATVMTGVARGMTGLTDQRSALQRAHAGHVRLQSYVMPGRALIQHDPARGFALWLDDNAMNGVVNLREVRAVWWNAQAGTIEVERVEFPQEWPEALKRTFDVTLTKGSDFLTTMSQQRALGYTKAEVIADGLTGWSLAHEGVSVEAARRVRLSMSLDAGNRTQDVLSVLSFVHHAPPK